MNVSRISLMLMRAGAGIQLILGIAFWTGHLIKAVPAHMMIGTIYVLLLIVIAILALLKRVNVGLALFAIVWAVVIAGFGMAQRTMLVGDMHWIVRVLHLVIALSAMPIAERLAAASSARSS